MRRWQILVIAVVLVVGGFLVYESLAAAVDPYITVSEVMDSPQSYQGKRVQVFGNIVKGTLDIQGLNVTFALTDNVTSLNVVFDGIPPSGIQDGGQVVVVGEFDGNNRIEASEILVKCPSKYEEAPST